MGLFDKFKKKKEPETLIDEKKIEEIEKYRSKGNQVIKDLKVQTIGKNITYIHGSVYCKLWDKEIDVDVYDDVSLDYVEKCAESMNSMPDTLVDAICRAAKKYCLDFLDAIGGAEENDIELTVPVDENTQPIEMLKCFDAGTLLVDPPMDPSKAGYHLSGNCDWEEEHGIEIVILDDKLVYLGEFSDESPWIDHSNQSWNSAAGIYE